MGYWLPIAGLIGFSAQRTTIKTAGILGVDFPSDMIRWDNGQYALNFLHSIGKVNAQGFLSELCNFIYYHSFGDIIVYHTRNNE
ncbi:hypothetical protein, partial [Dysgonomonas sp. 511]|uniref:hypothetical protein n=1 Tax=Dysgonomonas sp. 511 TaxID=2302930 RepID=UPI0013D86C2A